MPYCPKRCPTLVYGSLLELQNLGLIPELGLRVCMYVNKILKSFICVHTEIGEALVSALQLAVNSPLTRGKERRGGEGRENYYTQPLNFSPAISHTLSSLPSKHVSFDDVSRTRGWGI